MSEPFIGEVRIFAWNHVPQGWFPCDGRRLPIPQYVALYTLILNRFGGTPGVDFALPDLRGAAAVGTGTWPSGGKVTLGAVGGTSEVELDVSTMGTHSHTLRKKVTNAPAGVAKTSAPSAVSDLGGLSDAAGTVGYKSAITLNPSPDTMLHPLTVTPAGQYRPYHENRQPYMPMTYAIAYMGVFPT